MAHGVTVTGTLPRSTARKQTHVIRNSHQNILTVGTRRIAVDLVNTTVQAMMKYANLTQKHALMAATQTITKAALTVAIGWIHARTTALYRAIAIVAIQVNARTLPALILVGIVLILVGRLGIVLVQIPASL